MEVFTGHADRVSPSFGRSPGGSCSGCAGSWPPLPDGATPMSSPTFAALGVPARISDGLEARGIATPFPVQSATLPDALAGRDVCGRAPTGSGKTIAFGIPLIANSTKAAPHRPTALARRDEHERGGPVRRSPPS